MPSDSDQLQISLCYPGRTSVVMTESQDAEIYRTLRLLGQGNRTSLKSPGGTDTVLWVRNADAWRSGCELQIGDLTYEVDVNPSSVDVDMPKFCTAELEVRPDVLLQNCNEEATSYRWYRCRRRGGGRLVGEKKTYLPTEDDIGFFLRLEILPVHAVSGRECPAKVVYTSRVQKGYGEFLFEERHKHTLEHHPVALNNLRVVSYDVLAHGRTSDKHGKSCFPYCPSHTLSLEYRTPSLLREIKGYHSDLLCLQDVDRWVFDSTYLHELKDAGYSGFLGAADTSQDGCALFFRNDRFRLLQGASFSIGQTLQTNRNLQWLSTALSQNLPKYYEKLVSLNSMMQLALLQECNGKKLLVLNTKLHPDPYCHHTRLIQAGVMLFVLQNHVVGSNLPYVVCGDLSSSPEDGVVSYIATGGVSHKHSDWGSGGRDEYYPLDIQHNLSFSSSSVSPAIQHTVFSDKQRGVTDYVLFDKAQFSLQNVVPMISANDLSQRTAIPSPICPSDHLAVVVDLHWEPLRST